MSSDLEQDASTKAGADSDAQGDSSKGGSGNPLNILFPPDLGVWHEARRLVADKSIRVETLAVCCSQDPVIAIELLKTSNAMYFSGGRSPITSIKTSIVRLGSDVVIDTLDKMKDRALISDPEVSRWLEIHRSRCKRAAIVAKIISEAVARTLNDDCEASGLFFGVGEMLAVAHFKEKYVALANEHSRSSVNYKLSQASRFDVEKMCLSYLKRHGIPEALLFAIDRDGRSKTPDRAIMKPICMAAWEMIDAYDSNRWERIAPGKAIPPKSPIRMLQISDQQYLKVYERISEYLNSSRMLDERRRDRQKRGEGEPTSFEVPEQSVDQDTLQSEIQNIIKATGAESASSDEANKFEDKQPVQATRPIETTITTISSALSDPADTFALSSSKTKEKTVPRIRASSTPVVEPPQMRTNKAAKVLSSVSTMFEEVKSSEELLTELLRMLVDEGPFEKSALIVVSQDRKHAIVVAARGPNLGNGQKLIIDDPLSPLAQCFSKIQSFGNKESPVSPFGSKAFALSPIDADHATPVALYADCGNHGSLTFEARRIFRVVVDILNQKLPSLPGGIPIELSA